jgi:hypothetical protein
VVVSGAGRYRRAAEESVGGGSIMSVVEILQTVAALLGAGVSVVMAAEHKLVKRLRRERATSPDAAIEIPRLGSLTRWRIARLRSAGVVVENESGRMYLDEGAYVALRKRRVVVAVSLALTAVGVVVVVHHWAGLR